MGSVRVATFHGPDTIVDAVEALLGTPALDVVVVRALLSSREARRLRPGDPRRHDLLCSAAPGLSEVSDVLGAWWEQNGYRDYRFVPPGFAPGNYREGGLAAHLDPEEADAFLYGPVTMSVVSSRSGGVFLAERSVGSLTDDLRRYDRGAFERLQAGAEHPGTTGRRLRTAVPQGRGDAVLIMNHPQPTYHAVEARRQRQAHIFECLLESR